MRPFFQKLFVPSAVPWEAVNRQPYVQMFSDREVVVENVTRIRLFTDTCVTVQCGAKNVRIDGNDLHLICFFASGIAVRGVIAQVGWQV